MANLQRWLLETPKYTTFRINRLKKFDDSILSDYLNAQSKELGTLKVPTFYLLKPDCLVVQQWPAEVVIEKTGKDIIVDALCGAAVLRGANVYAPGVLGLPTNCQINEKIDIYADLDGKCKRGLKVPYDGKKLFVGVGYLKMLRYELFDEGVQPSGIAVQTMLPASKLPVVNETLYSTGHILLQNLPSIVVGWVVDAKPSELILDMCAAPGNKTTHLAEMSNNEALITAIDKTKQKVEKIEQNCIAHGITCVSAYAYDSTKCYSQDSENINKPPFRFGCFDKVLLDAPCSGLGQRPQLSNKMTVKMQGSYKFIQRKLFNAAVNVLKDGGKLVYSTCTVTEDENEGMVAWALKKFPCLQLVSTEPLLGGPGLANAGLSKEQRSMVQRFGPHDDELRPVEDIYRNTIGFFIAAFVKCNRN